MLFKLTLSVPHFEKKYKTISYDINYLFDISKKKKNYNKCIVHFILRNFYYNNWFVILTFL